MIKKNEKGYALVTVLLTLTIFMVLALSFMGQSANSAKQNLAVEDKAKSTAMAEMGISYVELAVRNIYQEKLDEVIVKKNSDKPQKTNEYYANETIDKIYIAVSSLRGEINNNNKLLFKIETYIIEKVGNGIKLNYSSNGNKNTPITAILQINYDQLLYDLTTTNGNETNIPSPPNASNSYTENNNKHKEIYEGNAIFTYKHGVTVSNGQPLEIKGSALFTTGLKFSGNPSGITIHGNAFFNSEIVLKGNENKSDSFNICIKGSSYLWDSKKKKYITYDIPKNSCSNPGNGGGNSESPKDPISTTVSYYGQS